jgi:hypothetical protein
MIKVSTISNLRDFGLFVAFCTINKHIGLKHIHPIDPTLYQTFTISAVIDRSTINFDKLHIAKQPEIAEYR